MGALGGRGLHTPARLGDSKADTTYRPERRGGSRGVLKAQARRLREVKASGVSKAGWGVPIKTEGRMEGKT